MARASMREAIDRTELRMMMRDWPAVMRQATDEWAQVFSADIWKLAGNGQWRPTLRQSKVMRRLWRELSRDGDEVILIE